MEGRGEPEDGAPSGAGSEADQGALTQQISDEVARLYKHDFGKGPLEARTYLQPDLVVVVLSGGYTASEQTLFDAGKWYEVRQARQHWQDSMKVRFIDKIEGLTGRNVKAFMSANTQDPDLAVELFVLHTDQEQNAPA